MTANYVLLEKVTLTADAASVVLDNIPQTGYTDLKVVVSGRSDRSAYEDSMRIRFNSDTGANYKWRTLAEYNSSTNSGSDSAATFVISESALTAASATANTFGSAEFYIPNYAGSNQKSVSNDSLSENNGTQSGISMSAGLWTNTAAITSINLSPRDGTNFLANSSFYLYGLAAVGTTPVIAPLASGGNIVTNDGTYWYHAFTSSGTFTANKSLTADCLVVAGGGGAGDFYGAGGGGGGLLHFASQSLSPASYTCTIGAGGAAGVNGNGTVGADSQFGALTLVKGGGYGKGEPAGNGGAGGSGGGASGGGTTSSATGGTATSGQGNAGGNVTTSSAGSGGGGAGSTGFNATGNVGGAGGYGSSTYATYGSVTGTGYSQSGSFWFAGGGAGAGTSGNGGQANGSTAIDTAGQVNTGQGGGADGNSPYIAKAGGSGIVIIRYPMAS